VVRFPPRRHRLEKVAVINNVNFWNDSKATNFAATYAALKEFEKPVIWIGGGLSKGGDIKNFAREVADKVKSAFLIGGTAEEIASGFNEKDTPADRCETMQDAVFSAFEKAEPNDIVLLSPGFSSQDMFDNYDQRGTSFENAVMSLKVPLNTK
jgi:UDP-N-acetylmuramoylalanine--D-glutamate ligase